MPLYVADALEADEREELRHHLAAGCVACAGHLAEAEATFAAVPLGMGPVAASPDLLRRVMERIDRPVAARGGASFAWRLFPAAAAAAVLAAGLTYAGVNRHDRFALDNARLTYNADARAALLRSALEDRDQTLEQLRRELAGQQQLVDALQSAGARVIELAGKGQPGASARLVWAPAAGRSVLLASHLMAPPPGRTYELWFITGDKRTVPAGTFDVNGSGAATVPVEVPSGLAPLAAAAVSDEPSGGTATPTGHIQLVGQVR